MALTYERGKQERPKGHAILYFRSGDSTLATYLLVLPIRMDVGKYLPPLLASQLGSMGGDLLGEGMNAFAAPPAPEPTPLGELRRIAELRDDDLLYGGTVASGDIPSTMNAAAEATQEYARAYQRFAGEQLSAAGAPAVGEEGEDGEDVQHVLFGLLSERERMGEISKAVGQARFAVERGDQQGLAEAETALKALEAILPEHFWIAKLRPAAVDPSQRGARLAQLYVDRCYKLLAEDFAAVQLLEHAIQEAGG